MLSVVQMLMSLLMNPGDTIMCEEFTYPHMIESFVIPKGFKVLGITTDDQGIIPEALSKALEARTAQGGTSSRLLYTVPVGQNPTGRSFPAGPPPSPLPPPGSHEHGEPLALCVMLLV